jgi:hypothetical protein
MPFGKKDLSQEDYDWIFVGKVPMLCEKKNIQKQQKIETWLNLYQLNRELGEAIAEAEKGKIHHPINYVS